MTTIDPFERGRSDYIQDRCENAPFSCIGGLDARQAPVKPRWLPENDWIEYLRGYTKAAEEHLGEGWRDVSFGWKPALMINEHKEQPLAPDACEECGGGGSNNSSGENCWMCDGTGIVEFVPVNNPPCTCGRLGEDIIGCPRHDPAKRKPTTRPLDAVRPPLQSLFDHYLRAEPDGDVHTFLSWLKDELSSPQRKTRQ